MTSNIVPSRQEFDRQLIKTEAINQRLKELEHRNTPLSQLAAIVRQLQKDVARIETQTLVYLSYLEDRIETLEDDAGIFAEDPPIELPENPGGGGGDKFPEIEE